LSTLAAAVPVVTLLVLIAAQGQAHIAAIIALVVAKHHHHCGVPYARQHVGRASVLGVVVGFFRSEDRPQRHFPLSRDGRDRAL